MTTTNGLLADVSAASAAFLFNLLPALLELPAAERYERLVTHFEACLVAYRDGLNGWLDPSEN